MSNQFEINANNTSHTLGIAGEAEMSGIFWVKNFISESAFSAIAQPLFYAFGGITLAKMLIESGKSYKDIYIDNIDKNNKDKITQLAELIKTVNNKTENWPSINKYLAKGSAHTLGFIIHLVKTQAADIFNPYSKLKWHERALKLANLAILVVCFGAVTAAISKVAPIIFLSILATSAIAAIYNAGEKLHQAIQNRKTNQKSTKSTISEKAELALTVTNFAATITGVVGLFLFPSMGIVNKASKTMGLAGASLQSSGVALSFRNAYNNWNKKDKTKNVERENQEDSHNERESLLGLDSGSLN